SSLTAATLTLTSSGDIGSSGQRLNTTVATLNATSTTGSVFVTENDSLTVGSLTANAANQINAILAGSTITLVTISANAGNRSITLWTIFRTYGTGSLRLPASCPARLSSDLSSLTAATLTLTSSGDIGSSGQRLNTTVATLNATSTSGSIFVQESDSITLGNL